MVNDVYDVPGDAVLKIERHHDGPLYRSLDREVAACRFLAASHAGLAPEVLAADHGWATFSRIGGAPLPGARSRLTALASRRLSATLGETIAALHTIDAAGMPGSLGLPYAGPSWSEQMLSGFASLAAYVGSHRPDLRPTLDRRYLELEHRIGDIEVATRGLVHGDYGGANIHVDDRSGLIVGVVDWEWAVCGDADLDLVRIEWLTSVGRSARLWTDGTERRAFHDGYSSTAPGSRWTEKFRWYGRWLAASYLALHLALAADPRSYVAIERSLQTDVLTAPEL